MNLKERRQLIVKLVKSGRKNRKMLEIPSDRDVGIFLEPTRADVNDELNNMQGFRHDVKQTDVEEMFYGIQSSFETTTEE